LQFELFQKTHVITLHSLEITVVKAVLHDGQKTLTPHISYDEKAKTVMFTFDEELTTGEKSFTFSYTGLLGEKMKGFYRSQYEINGEKRFMATTQFEEIGARQAFIGVDEPAAKAVFEISLIVPKNLTAISNTIPQKEEEIENDLKKVLFLPTPIMSTYSLAFIVGEFESVEKKTKNGIQVRVFVTPGKKQQAAFALETGVKLLEFYEEYFGISYPLPVLDLIAIPDFDAGAMENWGAVTFREVAILIDSEKSSIASKQWVALVIAHELAHMWFGNLVTMEWWTHLWLNEGFASYIEYFATDKLFPEWNLWDQFFALDHNAALALDGLKNTHPIEVEVEDIDKLKEIFDEISYAKGASVIAMLASFLGERDFREGLRYYLKKHSYGNAVTQDLWEALEEVSKKPVRKIMQNFTKKPGYPLIHITDEKDHLHLVQKRFFSSSLYQNEGDSTLWNIPFSVVSSQPALFDSTYLMEEKEMQLPQPTSGNWVKINADETSFLRAIYSENLYQAVRPAIEEKTLSSTDRMAILRDVFDGAEAGILSTTHALSLAQSYRKETSFAVWASLSGKISSVFNLVARTNGEEAYKAYARSLFTDIVQKVGWDKKEGESVDDVLMRNVVLYAYGKYGDSGTIEKAKELFWDFITNKKPIDSDMRGVVYLLVAQNGGEKEFETLMRLYKEETLSQEKNRIGNALMSFSQANLLQMALDFSLSDKVRLQDSPRFIILGFSNEYGREVTWQFLKKHWNTLHAKLKGQHGLGRLIEGAGIVVDQHMRDDIQQFFVDNPTEELSRTIEQVLEQIDSTIAWVNRDRESITNFLQKLLDS
ncbi:MAG TPA: M1 family metallopeptidase, partial [Candidatus Saccharimonadales bacterium]|nr:M1 family metallopeptidase [Candidatus Saccharimonadales bacterium]